MSQQVATVATHLHPGLVGLHTAATRPDRTVGWSHVRIDKRCLTAQKLDCAVSVIYQVLTLCGLTSQKTHRGGLGLGGAVHEEAHPCFLYFTQTPFQRIDAGER